MGEQQQRIYTSQIASHVWTLSEEDGGAEGKLARQMKDRRKYYDTWMEGDEACAQLSLWEELLSSPGFSIANSTTRNGRSCGRIIKLHRYSRDVMGEMFKKGVCYEL